MKYLKNNNRSYKVYYENKTKKSNKELPNFNTESKIYPKIKTGFSEKSANYQIKNQNFCNSYQNFHQPYNNVKDDKQPNYSNNYIKLSDIPNDSQSGFNSGQSGNFSNENNFNKSSNGNMSGNQGGNMSGNAFGGNLGGLAQILGGLGNGQTGMAGGLQSLLPLLGGMNGGGAIDLINSLSKNNPNLSSIMGLMSELNKSPAKPPKKSFDKDKNKKYIKIADYYIDN